MLSSRALITQAVHRFWRLRRGFVVDARGAVIDDEGRILLVRDRYQPGWHFPGGPVKRRETMETALARELEQADVRLTGEPKLFGLYANFHGFPSDHVMLFVVRHWKSANLISPSGRVAEPRFFAKATLPDDIDESTNTRILEILDGKEKSSRW